MWSSFIGKLVCTIGVGNFSTHRFTNRSIPPIVIAGPTARSIDVGVGLRVGLGTSGLLQTLVRKEIGSEII